MNRSFICLSACAIVFLAPCSFSQSVAPASTNNPAVVRGDSGVGPPASPAPPSLLRPVVALADLQRLGPISQLRLGADTYRNVTWIRVSAREATFEHAAGVATVRLNDLLPSLRDQFDFKPRMVVAPPAATSLPAAVSPIRPSAASPAAPRASSGPPAGLAPVPPASPAPPPANATAVPETNSVPAAVGAARERMLRGIKGLGGSPGP